MRIAVAGATGLVGSRLTALARKEGHDIVEIARETGVDLLDPAPGQLEQLLKGADAAVEVTSSPSLDEDEAKQFFTTVATNLGRAATQAGVGRTVTLSIVGVDRAPDYGYYVAKLAQEDAARAASPGAVVLRATQFHQFAGQMLGWFRNGDVVQVIDVPTQPVDVDEIVRVLLDMATGALSGDVQLAGPKVENLADQVRTLVERSGESLTVEPVPAPQSLADGAMLPAANDDVLIRGVDWSTWLDQQA